MSAPTGLCPLSAQSMKEAGAEAGAAFGAEGEGHEWELGIGSLIIDLDADIEKTAAGTGPGDGLRMKIKRKNGGKVKHHEVVMAAGAKKRKTVGTMTEPELFGPCEPGTSVTLDGVVWQETDGGVLVVNVTWREKSYVGTLLDCTRHDWAPPRLCDEQPTNDQDPKRSKRSLKVRPKSAARRTANSGFAVPPSPGKQAAATSASTSRPALIQCPEPNCNKKYKHINGLKYHQTHAHGDRQPPAAVTPVPSDQAAELASEPQDDQPDQEQSQPAPASTSSEPSTPSLPATAEDETKAQPCPSSPAYSDISDANEESEEQGAESPDDLPADTATAAIASAPTPVCASMTTTTTAAPDAKPFTSYAFSSNANAFSRSRDERADGDTLTFPYPYSYPAAFSLPVSPGTVAQNETETTGVCATMETTGPPPAPTSSYFLHPLSFPHFDPVFRMFPDKPGPPSQPTAAAGPATAGPAPAAVPQDAAQDGAAGRSPPTQRHLHTHHHTHVGVPFPSYHPAVHPIAAFPLLPAAPRPK